jgi:alpha-glucosidase (family GH31 glycosyl hydrolase)
MCPSKLRKIPLSAFIRIAVVMLPFGAAEIGAKPAEADDGALQEWSLQPEAVILVAGDGRQLRLRPYGEHIVRVQEAPPASDFFPDDHYRMVEHHDHGGSLRVLRETAGSLVFTTGAIEVTVDKATLRLSFGEAGGKILLREGAGRLWHDDRLVLDFVPDPAERFLGHGQPPLGFMDTLELTKRTTRRNYAEVAIQERGAQGNLLVPFYFTNKGYGVFVNSTFPNEFAFNAAGTYALTLETDGFEAQFDYFFLLGPEPATLLERYIALTGRPRLPPKSIFGLHLSDNDPPFPGEHTPHDASWWMRMVENHLAAGFPLDHMVFDNDWRAPAVPGEKGGGWGNSAFSFDERRFPDPAAFARWYRDLGLTLSLDLNMNNANDSAGWKPEYNLPIVPGGADTNADSYPDYTRREVRDWQWQLFWDEALNPALGYPGEGLWMDESDGVWGDSMPDSVVLANGRSWKEFKNYFYFLVGEAVTADGWDNAEGGETPGIGERLRPYVWVRGGTAGGQRFSSHWTGDIYFDDESYTGQILALQASGMAGYPYFNHDAGGFSDNPPGPVDTVYIQWGLAFGSFTPIWRPHGYGLPRFPLNRSEEVQAAFHQYGTLRYEMMPYIYTLAHEAHATGLPMARAMAFAHPEVDEAWKREMQYLWGPAFLIAPGRHLDGRDVVQEVWLPAGADWYNFWTGERHAGDQIITHAVKFGQLPIYVRTGAIVPKQDFALTTARLSDAHLTVEVYAGASGAFTLVEDDGRTERFRTRGEIRRTRLVYTEGPTATFAIHPAQGTYQGASAQRTYTVRVRGLGDAPAAVTLGGQRLRLGETSERGRAGASWDAETGVLTLEVPQTRVDRAVDVTIEK